MAIVSLSDQLCGFVTQDFLPLHYAETNGLLFL
jgi:hypothetical protein